MKRDELKHLVNSTSDPSFAVDSQGVIVAWNRAAELLFGPPDSEAMGRRCGDVLKGSDECGGFCSENCTVRQAIAARHPVANFDLEVETLKGRQWCNVSVLTAEESGSTRPLAIHLVRPVDLRKRLENVVRDFIVSQTSVTAQSAIEIISSRRTPAQAVELSARELEILRLLAQGESSQSVATRLHISRTTVNNHVQHLLRKLNAHNRLEAIRRAERAGLI